MNTNLTSFISHLLSLVVLNYAVLFLGPWTLEIGNSSFNRSLFFTSLFCGSLYPILHFLFSSLRYSIFCGSLFFIFFFTSIFDIRYSLFCGSLFLHPFLHFDIRNSIFVIRYSAVLSFFSAN
ncbi:MAG: hypothetical protein C4576_00980 [Desulfobacteraceae bacterium]|nr:MAG: hypothetical protein C4576_00980 [Desulfobacteraceae bacterium]